MATSSEQIKAEIEATRNRLGDDLDRLADRVSPRGMAQRGGRRVLDGASDLRDRAFGTAGTASAGAQEAGQTVRERAEQAPGAAAERTRGNPLAAGLLAFGAGFLAAALMPPTQAERDATGRLADQANRHAGPVRDAARESARHLKDDAADTGRRTAQDIRGTASDAAQDARDQVKQNRQSHPSPDGDGSRPPVYGDWE
ncbi:DUF3618 domain-containing protein [Streptomyces sp. NPDC049881]|uniref:DUF3618 domain-containing protein n=1 Tax=Streptomyces sp. NPDC049881 TaxID=3155778 RepID=UPI00341CAE7E